MEMLGQLHAPRGLSPTKGPRYPLNKRLGGPQSRYGRFQKRRIFCPMPEFEPGSSSMYPNHCCHYFKVFIFMYLMRSVKKIEKFIPEDGI
jgi:hypothetical protein